MNNVIYTKVNFFRNVKDYKFTPKLEEDKKQEIISKLQEILTDFTKIDYSQANEQLKKYINDNLMLTPKYNTLFLNKKNNVAVLLFEGEHIIISSICEDFSDTSFNKAKEIESLLANKLNLTFNDQYGYLMSDLSKIGSGLKIEACIDLNAINQLEKIEQVKRNLIKLGYSLFETDNKNIYILSTVCNLGFSESEIKLEFEKTLTKLQELEIESAKMLDVENHDNFIDMAQRSLAILSSAHLLTFNELKKLISNLRLALNLNLINIKLSTINKLQALVLNKNKDFISKSELIDLANNVKNILKGE